MLHAADETHTRRAESSGSHTASNATTTAAAASLRAHEQPYMSDEALCAMAQRAVLVDFARQRRYAQLRRDIAREQRDVQVIALTSTDAKGDATLVRPSHMRTLHDYKSAARQLQLRQFGLYGLTGVLTLAMLGTAWLGVTRNRFALLAVPLTAGLTWQLWSRLERTWERQRYYEHIAQRRDARAHDPARDAVVVAATARDRRAASAAANDEVKGAQ